MPLKPIFQWSAIVEANSYELLVSTDASFTNAIIIKTGAYALPSTAWQSDVNLDHDTAYYWKVRGISPSSYNTWSAVSAFTTKPSPELIPPESSSSFEPPPSSQSTTPNWIGSALLLTMLAILITVIILTVKVFRL
jgi:hypothetical protein